MENKYKYNAFISYRHVSPDKEIADKLQKKLENYKPPKSISGKKGSKWKIFRDETELNTSSNLSGDIRAALEVSEYLIVICSKTTKDSPWCMEEIEYFKELHNGNNSNIITIIADGDPGEVFPPVLCNELIPVTDEEGNVTYQNHVIEPLAANVSASSTRESLKKLNTEFLRIAAPLLGCGYDNLYNREHKKKIRRFIAAACMIIAFLLLFVVYNSAMLWEINKQKTALAAANDDLQKSNHELEKKTKEAEENLKEAQKQRLIAEQNLAEATNQKKIAEKNLTEANRQEKIANDNAKEADSQRGKAENNAREANEQRNIAEANAKEANIQKGIAENNAKEADNQRNIAEKNMNVAIKNEAKALEANRNLREKNAVILADQAEMYLENENIQRALELAIEAMPGEGEDILPNAKAQLVMTKATNSYERNYELVNSVVKLYGYVEYLEFSEDGSRLLANDSVGNVYIIDYDNNKIIKTFTPFETFNYTFNTSSNIISDITVDGNKGLILCNGQLISVNLYDGSINWSFTVDSTIGYSCDEMVTNPEANYINIIGGDTHIYLDKEGNMICEVKPDDVHTYKRNLLGNSYIYMDTDGNVYFINEDNGNLCVINKNGGREYELGLSKDNKAITIGENKDCIFVNVGIPGEYINFVLYDDARMYCLSKKDMSVVWQKDYQGTSLMNDENNTIFDYTTILANSSGEYELREGVLSSDRLNTVLFDKYTGEIYYHAQHGKELLWCMPNNKTTAYDLIVAYKDMFTEDCYLDGKGDLKIKEKDDFILLNGYNFDNEREIVAYHDRYKFALVSESSAEINIYHQISEDNYSVLNDYPGISSSTEYIADDGRGNIAMIYYDYNDGETERFFAVYNINTRSSVIKNLGDFKPGGLLYTDNKFLVPDSKCKLKVFDCEGNILEESDLSEKLRDAAGSDIYVNLSHLGLSGDDVILVSDGIIFTLDTRGSEITVSAVCENEIVGSYAIDNNFVSCFENNKEDNIQRIMYFRTDGSGTDYVKDNGNTMDFEFSSIKTMVNNAAANKLAFISKEGYIGIYSCGEDNILKIDCLSGNITPLSIKFTPDGNSLIAMCSDGRVIRYDIKSGKAAAEYKADFEVTDYKKHELWDENSLYIEAGLKDIVLDIETMEKKAEIENIEYYIKSHRKILCTKYVGSEKTVGYYEYYAPEQLTDKSQEFLDKYFN